MTKTGNPITDLLKFLYNDFKTDYEFVRDVLTRKRTIKFTPEQIEELKDWRGILKENWLFFIIVAAAFCSGYLFAQVMLNNACIHAVEDWYMQNMAMFGTMEQSKFETAFNLTINP